MKAETITASEINTELINHQADAWRSAAAVVTETADAYLANVESRKKTLEEQAAKYTAELSVLKKERGTLAAHILDLSSRGNIDAAAEADIKLEAMDQKLHALGRKLKIVNNADPKGDPQLYAAAQAAYKVMTEQREPYIQRIDTLRAAVDQEIQRLESIKKALFFARDTNHGRFADTRWEKVDRHYRDLDRVEQEERERAIAERKAKEEAASRTSYVIS